MIVRMGVGFDNVDVHAAGRLGIAVCNIPGLFHNNMLRPANNVMMMMFYVVELIFSMRGWEMELL